jgi:hypothetical protein
MWVTLLYHVIFRLELLCFIYTFKKSVCGPLKHSLSVSSFTLSLGACVGGERERES